MKKIFLNTLFLFTSHCFINAMEQPNKPVTSAEEKKERRKTLPGVSTSVDTDGLIKTLKMIQKMDQINNNKETKKIFPSKL